MSEIPSLDLFKGQARWKTMVMGLEPNVPVALLDVPSITGAQANSFRRAARELGRKVALRSVDGQVWACWLVDES